MAFNKGVSKSNKVMFGFTLKRCLYLTWYFALALDCLASGW
jgi:hypothetical protein